MTYSIFQMKKFIKLPLLKALFSNEINISKTVQRSTIQTHQSSAMNWSFYLPWWQQNHKIKNSSAFIINESVFLFTLMATESQGPHDRFIINELVCLFTLMATESQGPHDTLPIFSVRESCKWRMNITTDWGRANKLFVSRDMILYIDDT